MIKKYKDERINDIIKNSFEVATKDSEWKLRSLVEWNTLFEDVDKVLEYVENGKQGRLFVDSNMWWVLQNALIDILNLYGLQLIGERNNDYMEEVVTQYESELIAILNRYDKNWVIEPLDGDEVDKLVEHLRNMLNYMNGNITYKEYIGLEERG